jgi:cytidyltransferase-like protein
MTESPRKKVFVTGCFDMLHSGHIAFLEEAATHGALHMGIGSDQTIRQLKGRYPLYNEHERKYMLESLRCVHKCTINSGSGIMDFVENPDALSADVFFVNEDGNSPLKEEFCRSRGIRYVVSSRLPHADLPTRSTTGLRRECSIPYRIDLAGGWLDQPFVSKFCPGSVLTISIEPTIEFNDRSGMATSTRRKAIELWHTAVPPGDNEHLAKVLFSYENPPGKKEVAGSQDAVGIVFPGLNNLHYRGEYWPQRIESVHDESILRFIEQHLFLITLQPRHETFRVLERTNVTASGAQCLADAADRCWQAITNQDVVGFGKAFAGSFDAQVAMFPFMVDDYIRSVIESYRSRALGWKLSGAGGGGYVILISDTDIPGAMKVNIRRRSLCAF